MNPAYAAVLGPVFGVLLAKFIPDETQWYTDKFLFAASAFIIAAAFYTSNAWLAIALAGAALYGLAQKNTWLVALAAGLLAARAGIIGQQLLLVGLIPAAGYLYSHGQRTRLWWFALMPIVITAAVLL